MTREAEVDEGVDRTPLRAQTDRTFDVVTFQRDVVELDVFAPGVLVLEGIRVDGDRNGDEIRLDLHDVDALIGALTLARAAILEEEQK